MSLTRRGGDFFWLKCDACESFTKLLRWADHGGMIQGRKAALETLKGLLEKGGWRASPDGKAHACPQCLLNAEAENLARRRHVAVP